MNRIRLSSAEEEQLGERIFSAHALGTGFPSKPNSFAQQSTALEEAKRDEHKLSTAYQPPVSVRQTPVYARQY